MERKCERERDKNGLRDMEIFSHFRQLFEGIIRHYFKTCGFAVFHSILEKQTKSDL